MPHTRNRNPSPIPEVTWDTGLKEMNETWKGAIACFGVAIFFVMTIGIIYWQVVDQPNKNWILRGSFSGMIWERRSNSLVIQTASEDKTFVEIYVGDMGTPDNDVPFVRNLCWYNKTEFCYTWDSVADLKVSVESDEESEMECYRITWIPLHCHVELKDCFSMANVSWYGGAGVHAQSWPINAVNVSMQPFTVSNLKDNPLGYGSVLERYFLGSTGVAVLVDPEVSLHVGVDSQQQYCLRTPPNAEQLPLQYMVCVGPNAKVVHQEAVRQLSNHKRVLPNMDILRSPFWKLLVNVDSGRKLERELRSFSNRLKRHHLGEGIITLNEHSTYLLSSMQEQAEKMMFKRQTRNVRLVQFLNISVTLSPFLSVDTPQFHNSLQEGTEAYWLTLPVAQHGRLVPLLTQWKGKFCVKLNITNPAAVNWFLNKVGGLHARLGMEYVILEGGEGNPFEEQAMQTPKALAGDEYIGLLAGVAAKIGDTAIVTSGTRSSHVPLFIRMNPLHNDWSYSGLKGLIPSVLHYSLLGYDFFIPDAVGGSLSRNLFTDEELFIRWLEIASFLPTITFQIPPWVYGDNQVLNLTRVYIAKHQAFVVPLIVKYAKKWKEQQSPIYRPLWWISPDDPITFTIDDEFLIGDEVLIAPVTEKGALHRNIYLPGNGLKWEDQNNSLVFDGGTLLESYPVGLEDVAVFMRRHS
ncbi:SITS-binding protein isoform X1 [Paramormyrops kingsleyae]|uniref:Si:ch211-236l14.4 n=1 Tax=Paramormyrops kingsleyae TaxID=1676925 RepID=A0A3B3R6V8_9TELE|nr:SITS-binding protein-like isoform X1 [Paramormyrops kingsleyae]